MEGRDHTVVFGFMTEEIILFTGDLLYDSNSLSQDMMDVSSWIQARGYQTIVNLEGGIDSRSFPAIKKRGPNHASSACVEEVLSELNTVGCCMANNHIMDFGVLGLEKTLIELDRIGIQHTGAGINIECVYEPIQIHLSGLNVGIAAFGWQEEETQIATRHRAGCASYDVDVITRAVKEMKGKFDKVVVCLHFGFEYNRYPMPVDINISHAIIDAGADLIIGHHPHCVQPLEIYHGKRIYYSLGNFYFGTRRQALAKKRFHEPIENQCNFGVLVAWNPIDDAFLEHAIQYMPQTDCSRVLEEVPEGILHKVSFSSNSEFNSIAYIRKVKQNRIKRNPVLTGKLDKGKLVLWHARHKVGKLYRKFIRK